VLPNIDYFAAVTPFQACVGGDHLIIVNFNDYNLEGKIAAAENAGNPSLAAMLSRNRNRFGILVADVAGHSVSNSVTANYLHAAFRTGVAYELKLNGEVTPYLFEILNTQFYNHISRDFLKSKPYITLIYGEVHNNGTFRFLSAGHPYPIVFSKKYNSIVRLDPDRTKNSTSLGVMPSEYHIDTEHFGRAFATKSRYDVNEIRLLGEGDILLLYTDGFLELDGGSLNFCETRLEPVLRENKERDAREIYAAIMDELHRFCPPEDDLTLAVIKRRG
jgi:serine phosphatase RsbU (regulator of sigma subunit)